MHTSCFTPAVNLDPVVSNAPKLGHASFTPYLGTFTDGKPLWETAEKAIESLERTKAIESLERTVGDQAITIARQDETIKLLEDDNETLRRLDSTRSNILKERSQRISWLEGELEKVKTSPPKPSPAFNEGDVVYYKAAPLSPPMVVASIINNYDVRVYPVIDGQISENRSFKTWPALLTLQPPEQPLPELTWWESRRFTVMVVSAVAATVLSLAAIAVSM
jgi:hypothetical protein